MRIGANMSTFTIHTYRGNEIVRTAHFKCDIDTALEIYDVVESLIDLNDVSICMLQIITLNPFKERFICSTELTNN